MAALTIHPVPRTANERMKEGFELTLAVSFGLALAAHVLVFQLWPTMEVQPWTVSAASVEVIAMDKIDLPDEPAPLNHPAKPVAVSSMDVSDELTLDLPTWKEAAELPPPPPGETTHNVAEGIPFTPWTVAPRLANPAEAQRALEREYPSLLRDAGIGGRVGLLVHIDAAGKVLEARVGESSGKAQLDAAALKVVDAFRFSPALNRDRAVEVWIRIPITFTVH